MEQESHNSTTQGNIVTARRQRIEKKRELVNAQEELFGKTTAQSQLWQPANLVDYTLDQLKDARDMAEKIRACFIRLAICASFESDKESHDYAARVWRSALRADNDVWSEWIRTETNLAHSELVDKALQSTVFGGLVEQADGVGDSWGEVVHGTEIGQQVLEKVASLDASSATGMRRLLRTLTHGRW